MILIEDDQMIETFSADTSNYSFCVGFYDLTSTIITTRGHISPWSETPQSLEKSNLLRMAKSSPSHKSADCIIGIVGPRNFGAATGPRNSSTQIDRRRIASKGFL